MAGWNDWSLGAGARVYDGATGECGFDSAGATSWANSPVQDAGVSSTYYVTITQAVARGSYDTMYRFATSSFSATASTPSWSSYTSGTNCTLRYAQARIEKLS